jgi:glycosyltransferase involved in cell wall biosynthesis
MTPVKGGIDHAFVIPAYGSSRFLSACLRSIAAQTLGGSQVIIATSTPSAQLDAVARQYRAPLRVNPRRAGIGSDWNFALDATDASLVTLAHQDDIYRPDYLERMHAALAKVSDALLGFSDFAEATTMGPRPPHLNMRLKQFLCRRAFGNGDVIRTTAARRRLLAWGNPICCPSVVLNRATAPRFQFAEDLRSNLDWEAWLRLAAQPGAFVYVREPLVIRRIHAGSETSALIADQQRLEEDRAMFGRLWPAPIAAIITLVYRASYRANRT